MKIIKTISRTYTRCNLCFWLLAVVLFLNANAAHSQTSIKFTLDKSYTTSAGVYKPDGTLVRTLWRREPYAAGTYTVNWDGKDDAGNAMAAGQYQIKLLHHNVQYVLDGAIGNTSDNQFGAHVHNSFYPIQDMAATDTAMFAVSGYNEGHFNLRYFLHSKPQYSTNAGRIDATVSNSLVDTDGVNTYMANNEGGTGKGSVTSFVYAVKVKDNAEVLFAYGQKADMNNGYPGQIYASVLDFDQTSQNIQPSGSTVLSNAATGLAVQKNGALLAIAHRGQNVIRLFDKISGQLLRTIAATSPGSLSMSPGGDLWAVVGGNVVRYTNLATNPTIATTITGFTKPLAVATDPTIEDIVLVADGGTSQQVKAYNRTGSGQWTYGQLGGYVVNGNQVSTDKLWFNQSDVGETTFVTIAPDHSFWVGDIGNNRCLHFSAARAYIDQVMFQPHAYVAATDPNNQNRIFSEFLEFEVDYTKPLASSWKLVRNWRIGVDAQYLGFGQGFNQVTTFPNGRTYALMSSPAGEHKMPLVELVGTKVRFTGMTFNGIYDPPVTIMPDGSLNVTAYNPPVNTTATWQKRLLTGFDAANNPQWAAPAFLSSTYVTNQDPYCRLGGFGNVYAPVTSTGLVISYDHSLGNNYHLGAMKVGGTSWLWKTAPVGPLDGKGTYDIGNGVNYGGNTVVTAGRNILCGYHGEFWGGAQASQWMHYYDDGLVVGQFGETTVGHAAEEGVLIGSAGNGVANSIATQNGETYLWVNDEGGHGPMRWHILNAGSVQESSGTGTLGGTIVLSTPAAAFPTQVVATAGNAQLQLSWSPVAGAASYAVRYARSTGGPYTTAATSLTTNAYTLSGLLNDVSYYVVVDAQPASGSSASSEEIIGIPYDPAVTVHLVGATSSNSTKLTVNSAAPAAGQPALQVTQPLRYSLDKLLFDAVGKKGYLIYNWGGIGADKTNILGGISVSKGPGWVNDNYAQYNFNVDGVDGSSYALYSRPTNSVDITVGDKNWHYVTVFSPVQWMDHLRQCRVTLTPQGQTSPAATYTINELPSKNHAIQFRFKGNVTLTVDNQNGQGGTLQALFFDDEVVATPIPSTSTAAQQLASFTLVNADNGQDIKVLASGETLSLATLPSRNLSIRANTSPTAVGSVLFSLSGTQTKTTTDNGAPYTLFGDNSGTYTPWPSIAAGSYTLQATPYTGSGNTGTAGTPLTTSFTITDPNTLSTPKVLYRINAGGNQLVTSLGTFQADNFYAPTPGVTASTTAAIANTDDDALYQVERRAGNQVLSYKLAVPNGRYTVILHFAETQWQGVGKRQFDVMMEGKKVLDNYDIYKKVGSNAATTETITTSVSDGVLSIRFSSLASDGGIDQPTIAALQVLSASTGSLTGNGLTLATASPTNDSETMIYPNPTADGKIVLELPAQLQGELNYTLVSATGSTVAVAKVALAGSATIALDLSQALTVPGIYYLRLQNGTWMANLKLSYTGN